MTETQILLTEEYVQNCFHSYLKSALTQAKVERLLDNEMLSSAEGDLMITGASLDSDFVPLLMSQKVLHCVSTSRHFDARQIRRLSRYLVSTSLLLHQPISH